jgi:diketogulonate reductase-like aldo/keto reductase
MNKTIKLNNGVEMPLVGYGVFQVTPEECERCVADALSVGYRSIDTAQAYFNEEGVGNAWRKSGISRDELFLTTKVWISNYGYDKAKASIDTSLRKLQTDYIDLLLLHQCFGDYYGAYRAMEDALKEGKVRAIGVSNFYYDRFTDIAENMSIVPAVNQIEVNVFAQQHLMQQVCEKYGTHLMAWGPLAEGFNDFFNNPDLKAIGEKYGKSVAQVALHWLIQRGIIVIPKSVHKERMMQNFDITNFSLSDEDMHTISALDLGHGVVVNFEDPQTRMNLQELVKKYSV